jgi:general secretion pathway protein M
MKQWFEHLQPRERLIVSIGAGAALLIVFWALVWQPLRSGSEELRNGVADKQRLLGELYRVSAISPQSADGDQGATSSLFLLVDRSAKASGLASSVTRQSPDGPNGMNVSFQNASFELLTDWLISLQQNDGVFVDGAQINSTRERGLVSGQVSLRRN